MITFNSSWLCRTFALCAAALLAAVPVVSRADRGDLWLDFNGASWHTAKSYSWEGQTRNYNQTNFGLGLGRGLNDWSELKGGWFENSYYKTSVYLTLDVKPTWIRYQNENWFVAPGVAFGAVTGYQDTPEQTGAVAPWALLNVSFGNPKHWRFVVGYLPSTLFVKNGVNVVTLQFSLKLRP